MQCEIHPAVPGEGVHYRGEGSRRSDGLRYGAEPVSFRFNPHPVTGLDGGFEMVQCGIVPDGLFPGLDGGTVSDRAADLRSVQGPVALLRGRDGEVYGMLRLIRGEKGIEDDQLSFRLGEGDFPAAGGQDCQQQE